MNESSTLIFDSLAACGDMDLCTVGDLVASLNCVMFQLPLTPENLNRAALITGCCSSPTIRAMFLNSEDARILLEIMNRAWNSYSIKFKESPIDKRFKDALIVNSTWE